MITIISIYDITVLMQEYYVVNFKYYNFSNMFCRTYINFSWIINRHNISFWYQYPISQKGKKLY